MAQDTYQVGANPQITVTECAGRLVVRVWNRDEVSLKGNDVQVEEKSDGKGLQISSQSELKITAPAGTSLVVQQAHSDLLVKGVQGHVMIQKANADVILRDCGDVDLHDVHADLVAKHMSGRLTADTVHGDASLRHMGGADIKTVNGDIAGRHIHGDVRVGTVYGETRLGPINGDVHVERSMSDVRLDRVSGRGSVASAESDIRLFSTFGPGKHEFNCKGDITVRWPQDRPVKILASGKKFTNRLALSDESEKDGHFSGQIGEGEPDVVLILNAGNRVTLKEKDIVDSNWAELEFEDDDFTFDFDFSRLAGLGERIASRVNERFAQFETQLGTDMAAKIERQVEKAVRRAEKAAERAARKAERAQRRGYSASYTVNTKPRSQTPAQDTSAEQLHVLKMLEEGKISAQEASKLLDALS